VRLSRNPKNDPSKRSFIDTEYTAFLVFPPTIFAGIVRARPLTFGLSKRNDWRHAQNAFQSRFADQDMCSMRQAFHVAQEMGARLGGRQILLGALPPHGPG